MSAEHRRKLIKIVPGIAISAFFLWYTFKGISLQQLQGLRFVAPAWIAVLCAITCASYLLRSYRWWWMLRNGGARFQTCARVLMTSFAANNILPLRIGDFMRIFTYASDLGAAPSAILSTVILEKLLDVFTLVLIFVITMHGDHGVSRRVEVLAESMLCISSVGLLVLLFRAGALEQPFRRLFLRLPQGPKLAKIEYWILLALDALRKIGVLGSLALLLQSFMVWGCDGLIFIATARLVNLRTDALGLWQTESLANLSYLIPSSPGAIGPFEAAAKTTLVSHGANASQAALFGLAVHVWLLVTVTGAGGVMFLLHRYHLSIRRPLSQELETLPAELP